MSRIFLIAWFISSAFSLPAQSDSLSSDTIRKKIHYGLFGGVNFDFIRLSNITYFHDQYSTIFGNGINQITPVMVRGFNWGFYREKELNSRLSLVTQIRVQSYNSYIRFIYNNKSVGNNRPTPAIISLPVLLKYKLLFREGTWNILFGLEPRVMWGRIEYSDVQLDCAVGPGSKIKFFDAKLLVFASASPFPKGVGGNAWAGYDDFKFWTYEFGLMLML